MSLFFIRSKKLKKVVKNSIIHLENNEIDKLKIGKYP